MAGTTTLLMRPMSIKEIVDRAQAFDFNPEIELKYWLRTADMLLREARIYEQEGNYQQSYFLLMRYATLVAEKLSDHPSVRTYEGGRAFNIHKRTIPDVIIKLEALKPGLEARFSQWQISRASQRAPVSSNRREDRTFSRRSFDPAESDPAVAGNTTTLAATEHRELAVRLAHKELRRRDAARKTSRRAGISEDEGHERRPAGQWDYREKELDDGDQAADDDLRNRMIDVRRKLDKPRDIISEAPRKKLSKSQTKQSLRENPNPVEYRYPPVSKPQTVRYEERQPDFNSSVRRESYEARQPDFKSPLKRELLPPVPSKGVPVISHKLDSLEERIPPRRPEKQLISEPPSSISSSPEEPPVFTFRPSAYLENGSPLRTLFLPPSIRERFLSIAAPNTRANLETCGILCGTLISNALFVSHLVVPEQESTSDTCETVNESAIFDFCDSEDLMVLGWIHTHPTQTCFMSSRDLHTHCGYQVMLPESVAIVCAPSKNPSWGVFRLTDPPGMQSMLNCRQMGLFHPHAESNVYTDALRPGHVFEAPGLEFEVVDLRPGY